MKDLIYRLRDWNRTSHERNRVDMLAAADAIEKLEADLAKAQMHIKHIGNDALRAENAALLAANELSVARGLQLLGENTQLKAAWKSALNMAENIREEREALKEELSEAKSAFDRLTPHAEAVIAERDALKAELAARWIPITERLPEPEVSVLCYGPNTIQPDLPWIMFVDWRGSKPDFGRGVTHWRPLPAGPGANHG